MSLYFLARKITPFECHDKEEKVLSISPLKLQFYMYRHSIFATDYCVISYVIFLNSKLQIKTFY